MAGAMEAMFKAIASLSLKNSSRYFSFLFCPNHLLKKFQMISYQAKIIAEICIQYVKLKLKHLHSRNTTFLQNKFKNQGSTPLITGVKKASGFKSCQWSISSSWL